MTTQPPSQEPVQPGAQPVPTCYNHPDRETYVRCQRCDRPICPDCMNDASVGFQCPECVREGNKNLRMAQATFGGAVVSTPVVTYTLLALNIALYAAQLIFPVVQNTLVTSAPGIYEGEWWRLITGAFLHSTSGWPLHIVFNMWALWALGPELERRIGSVRFAALYLTAALGGSVAVYLFGIFAVGASGAIYGLFGAMFVLAKKLGYDMRGLLWLIGINVAITFLVPGISWQGHLGGLITGGLVAAVYAYAPRRNRNVVQFAGVAIIVAVLLLIIVTLEPYGLIEYLRTN